MGLLPCLGSADSRTFGTAEKSHRVSRGPAIVAGGPENAGLIRPITIVAPKGCLANPTFPAPTIARFCPGNQLADTVMKALSAAMPGNVSAGIGNLKVIAFLEAERGSFIERGERKRMQHRRAPAKERPDPVPSES
jgi:N-methylhydantoinase B